MILHVILTILKVIGILLLLLVLLAAALILSVLLVPIRYRLSAAFTGEKKQGKVKISWLLHLISVDASVELPISAERAESPEAEGDTASEDNADPEDAKNPFSGLSEIRTKVQLRILGIDPAAVRAYFQKRKQKKTEKNREKREKREKRSRIDSTARVKQTESGRQERQPSQREAGQREPSQRERSVSAEQTSARPEHEEQKIQSTDVRQPSQEPLSQDTPQVTRQADTEQASWTSRSEHGEHFPEETEKPDKAGAFLHKLRGFCGKIKQIPDQVRQLISKGKKLLQKPERMKRKVQRFLRKIEKYEAKEVLLDCWAKVKRMLVHFRVRRGRGYLRFGTGDPAFTGELAGVLYLLLPTSCGELQVEPQFTESMLETELEVRGHIRLVHLVRFALWAFFNKKLRRLIRAFRK